MKKLLYWLLISIPMLVTGCDTEDDNTFDKTVVCAQLADALVANDEGDAGAGINTLLATQGAVSGPEESFRKLIEQIDSCPTLQVTDSCYACIETNPLQSEIWVSVILDDQIIKKVIDLLHKDDKLAFYRIHD